MTAIWCKLWNFILNAFTDVLEAVGHTIATLGEVLVDVFSAVVEGVSGALGISPLTLVLLGVGAYLLFFSPKDEEKDEEKRDTRSAPVMSIPDNSGGVIHV